MKVAPVVPAFLMCAVLSIVLLFDLVSAGMSDAQYTVFPAVFRAVDLVIACGGLVFLVWAARSKKIEIHVNLATAFFAAFAALIIISTLVNGLTREAVYGIPYRNIGIFNMFAFMLVYMGVSGIRCEESIKEKALLLYLAVADAIGISALIDLYLIAIPAYRSKKELSAIFFNGNHYGYFLLLAVLIGIGFVIYGSGRSLVFGAASAAFNSFILVLNHSMGCILAVILVIIGMSVLMVIFDRDRLRRLAILLGTLAICIILALVLSSALRNEFATLAKDISGLLNNTADSSAGHNRLLLWSLTGDYIWERPLLGYGCEGTAFMLYDATGRSNAHNELLTYASYYGIPAALCYLGGVITIFAVYFKKRPQKRPAERMACMAAAGYCLSSLVGVAMFYTVPFFFIFLGMTACEEHSDILSL